MVPFCIGGVVNLRLHGTVSLLYFHGFPRQRKRVGCLTMELARNEINGVFTSLNHSPVPNIFGITAGFARFG